MVQVKKEFTPEELEYVKNNCATKRDKEIAVDLTAQMGYPVIEKTVRAMRVKLGIVKSRGRGACRILTAEEIKVLADNAAARKLAKANTTPQVEVTPQVASPEVVNQ